MTKSRKKRLGRGLDALLGDASPAQEEDQTLNLEGRSILTLWHGRIFYLFYHLRRRPEYFLLISPSQDGPTQIRSAQLGPG